MEKYEIKKYQILELAKESSFSNAYLQKHFPQAFKKSFEVGKIYKIYGIIFYCTEIDEKGNLYGYGIFNREYKNRENNKSGFWACNNTAAQHRLVEATPEEWKEAMTKELVKRYGEDWKNVKLKKCLWHLHSSNNGDCGLTFSETEIWNRNGMIFKDGIFAEVLDDQSELKERLENMQNELNEIKKLIK